MSEDHGERRKKEKWVYRILSWYTSRCDGEWVPTSVATTVRRKFSHFAKSKKWTKDNREAVVQVTEELVYVHHGYRPRFSNEKQTRKSFFFRGARVWRD